MQVRTRGSGASTRRRSARRSRSTPYVTLLCAFLLVLHGNSRAYALCEQKKVRGASLLQQHERRTAAAEAEKARRGDSGDKEEPPAFWDHSRDMALGGRLMDEKTRGKFIQEARGLGDRFGSGKSGGFL